MSEREMTLLDVADLFAQLTTAEKLALLEYMEELRGE